MKPDEVILLNVVNASVDFETSKSLCMSRKLDTNAKRTILCISKVDQFVDHGILKKVMNAHVNMHLPKEHIFVVRNRSQEDNERGVTLNEAREIEKKFLHQHSELSKLSESSKGIISLSSRLVQLQYDRIRETLPRAGRNIRMRIKQLSDDLSSLGNVIANEKDCREIIQHRLIDMQKSLVDHLNGRVASSFGPKSILSETRLASARAGGARKIQSTATRLECKDGSLINVQLHMNSEIDQMNVKTSTFDGPSQLTSIGDFFLRFSPEKGGLFICVKNVPNNINSIDCDTFFRAYEKDEDDETIENEIREHDLEYKFEKSKKFIGCGFNNFIAPMKINVDHFPKLHFNGSITINAIVYSAVGDEKRDGQQDQSQMFCAKLLQLEKRFQ